ncbi:sialin [Nilaparvata lugens]|uniref:sialin n=1 Tax=Nilaparvata lugens TaxID=108931 RepID=UPI00193E6C9E|nr:sialin [Nilaparvata lugens]
MYILKPLKKRTILMIMLFFGFALNFLFRHAVQMALIFHGFMDVNFTSETVMEEKALVRFYYGYLFLQIPFGRLAEMFGGKTLIGYGILGASLSSLTIPYAVKIGGYESLVVVNTFLGVFLATFNPAVINLASKWIPVQERGKLISSFASLSLGNVLIVVTLQIKFLTIEILFIIPGVFGIIWCLFWYILVYDSPLTHPSITRKERNYIVLKKESQGTIYKSIGCPWFEIGFDPNVWVVFTTHTCFWIGAIFLTTRCSTYLSEAFQLNPLKDPFLMMTPFFMSFTVAFLSGFLFDFLYDLGVPLTVLQKMFTAIATFLPAIALVGFISCQSSMSCTIFFYMIGIIFLPLAVGGYYTTFLDKSPNYAATLTAISATLANIGLVAITGVMKNLDIGLNRQQQWENRHSLVSALLFTAGTIFAIFGNNKEADWNTPYEYEAV